MNIFSKKIISKTSGFTLIETLVAITMLSMVIATVMSLVQTSLVASTYSKDQVTAKYLAEEGVEYIRHLRDENMVNNTASNPRNWMAGIAADNNASSPCGDITSASSNKICDVDPITGGGPLVCNGTCPALLYSSSGATNGQYSHVTGQPSKFTRTIKVTRVDGGNSAFSVVVSVTVTWYENSGQQTYTANEYLFNWYISS